MGQESSKSDRDSRPTPRQSLQRQQTSREPPYQTRTTMERQRNPNPGNRYGELQNMYPDLSKINIATSTQRVAPTVMATPVQRVASPTAQEGHFSCYGGANGAQRAAPTVTETPVQRVASPTTQDGHFNCYGGANGAQRAAPTVMETPVQRVASPMVQEGQVSGYGGAKGAQKVASTVMETPVQTVASPTTQDGHFNCYGGANGTCAKKQAEEFVLVYNYGHQQYQSQEPSAPPEHQVAGFESSKPRPSRPPPPRSMAGPSTPSTSAAPARAENNARSRSVSRVRSPDNRFNCPTCGLLLGFTIYSCDRGHSSCNECKLANRLCGHQARPGEVCRTPIGNIRNFALEAMVGEHTVYQRSSCPNAGCSLSFNIADMARHQQVCPFGETDCPMGTLFGQCQQRFKVDAMASHFDAFHREQRIADFGKEMFIFNICMASQKMFLLKNGPYNFLVHVKVAEQERNIYMTVQLYGTVTSASKWTYEFHVYNKSQPRRKFTFVDNCQSVATSVDNIFKDSKCAVLPLNFAMTFANDSVLTYKFFIKKTEVNNKKRRNNWKCQNAQQE